LGPEQQQKAVTVRLLHAQASSDSLWQPRNSNPPRKQGPHAAPAQWRPALRSRPK